MSDIDVNTVTPVNQEHREGSPAYHSMGIVLSGYKLERDNESGMLEYKGKQEEIPRFEDKPWVVPVLRVSVARKRQFLEAYRQTFPNFYRACSSVGVMVTAIKRHLELDTVFRAHYDELMNELLGKTLDRFDEKGQLDRNFLDRIVVAKAMHPEVFDKAQRIVVERSKQLDPEQAKARMVKVADVVDGEVVQAQFNPALLDTSTQDNTTEKSA